MSLNNKDWKWILKCPPESMGLPSAHVQWPWAIGLVCGIATSIAAMASPGIQSEPQGGVWRVNMTRSGTTVAFIIRSEQRLLRAEPSCECITVDPYQGGGMWSGSVDCKSVPIFVRPGLLFYDGNRLVGFVPFQCQE